MAIGITNDRMMIQKNRLLTVLSLSCVSLQLNPGALATDSVPGSGGLPQRTLAGPQRNARTKDGTRRRPFRRDAVP
jgi:hypothetical protein